jgi:hypothetical protein
MVIQPCRKISRFRREIACFCICPQRSKVHAKRRPRDCRQDADFSPSRARPHFILNSSSPQVGHAYPTSALRSGKYARPDRQQKMNVVYSCVQFQNKKGASAVFRLKAEENPFWTKRGRLPSPAQEPPLGYKAD